MTRTGLVALLACLVATGVVGFVRDDGASPMTGSSDVARLIRSGVLVRTPAAAVSLCDSTSAAFVGPHRCPPAIPAPDGAWRAPRTLYRSPCEYLVELQSGSSRGAPQRMFHLLFGGRCRPFDLRTSAGRWPEAGFLSDDLGLVEARPLTPGESAQRRAARPRVVKRLRVGNRRGLLLRYAPRPLTSIHTGHLAVIWNERSAGYVASGHPPEPSMPQQEARAIQALLQTAVGIHSDRPRRR